MRQSTDSPRSPVAKSIPTVTTTAVQPVEITTTAVVGRSNDAGTRSSDASENDKRTDSVQPAQDEPSRSKPARHQHQHHHFMKSPVFQPSASPLGSPLSSAGVVTPSTTTETIIFEQLPPPVDKGPSEAIAALQDAANESSSTPSASKTDVEQAETLDELFESCFFSGVLLLQWSNVEGPKVDKVWTSKDDALNDKNMQRLIAQQILNGEMDRPIKDIEVKWVVLHRQAVVCLAFLYNDRTLSALVFVLPDRYRRNFSPYLQVLRNRVPREFIERLVRLRKWSKRHSVCWQKALQYFGDYHIAPFIRSIMKLDSVSLPLEYTKSTYTIFDQESRQLFDSPFFAKVVTSHLQTHCCTVVLGSNLTAMNMMINALSLFLSPKEHNLSSHARKNTKYMPDLYLQGLFIQDLDTRKWETAVLDSPLPTTVVDMRHLTVKRTALNPGYQQLQKEYQEWCSTRLEEEFSNHLQPSECLTSRSTEWRKPVLQKAECVAPLVQKLLDDTRKLPSRLREAYVRQWRRLLIRRAFALIQFMDNADMQTGESLLKVKTALQIKDNTDLSVIAVQAEKLKPGMLTRLKRVGFHYAKE